MSVEAIQILSDSSKSIVTEKGTRSSYDKMIFNSSPSMEVKKRHTCSSNHATSFSTSPSTPSYIHPEHSYSAPTLTLYTNTQISNVIDSTSDINILTTSDSKSQHNQQQNNGNEITKTSSEKRLTPSDLPKIATHFNQEPTASTLTLYTNTQRSNVIDSISDINILTTSDSKPQHNQQQNNGNEITKTSSEKRLKPSDLPKIATHFNQEPTASSEFLKKKSQHQRVASDDSLASLTALPSPATSVQDFPITHNVKHLSPVQEISSADSKNYPHHLSHSEGHLQIDRPNDHHIDHHISDNGPISDHHALKRRLSKFGLPDTTELIGHYAILKIIGTGAFSEVKLAMDLNSSSHVAIKMIAIKGIEDSERLKASVLREVEILKYIDHPNIVRLIDTVETSTHLCLILEYVSGGELFDYVNDHYEVSTEEESKRIFLQLVNILEYLHGNDIVHRDLKLENILTVLPNQSPNGPIIKLTDFGLAKFIDKSSPTLNTRCGSEEYAAPELLLGKPYDGRKTDLWSLGIILYALLVGYLPFNLEPGQLRRQYFSKILRADFTFPNSEKETGRKSMISNEGKDLVKKILHNNPQKRLNLDEIKNHSWLKGVTI